MNNAEEKERNWKLKIELDGGNGISLELTEN